MSQDARTTMATWFARMAMIACALAGIGCKPSAPPAPPPPAVVVTEVVQRDVPIYSEWVGTTVGFVNAQVMPRVQVGYLVTPSTVLTTVSRIDPMKVAFPITEREYLRVADRINEHRDDGHAQDAPELQLILVDGRTYPLPGRLSVTDREVDRKT